MTLCPDRLYVHAVTAVECVPLLLQSFEKKNSSLLLFTCERFVSYATVAFLTRLNFSFTPYASAPPLCMLDVIYQLQSSEFREECE